MKFSIIIPTYNRGHIVGKAVESVLGQAFQDWELIIVDDGSVDQTPGTLNNFRNERIKIFRYTENKGASFARNFGLFKAKGSFIIFLDSDARFVPGALDTISGILKSTNEFYNDYLFIAADELTRKPYNFRMPDKDGEIDFKKVFRGELDGDYCHVTKRHIYSHIKFDEEFKGCERSCWHRIARDFGPGYFASKAVVMVNRASPDSITRNLMRADYRDKWVNILEQSRKYTGYFQNNFHDIYPEGYYNELKTQLKALLIIGRPTEARGIAKRMIRETPGPGKWFWFLFSILPPALILKAYLLIKFRKR